jgi:pyruvate/2-oxoglutarate dehydrogenase complex dihydrolipoamide dehydrogenase (E3) component
VLGGGTVGSETAEFLAQKQYEVTVIEMMPELANDMEPINRRILLDSLEQHQVNMRVGKKIVEVNPKGAIVEDMVSGERQLIEADRFVLALGSVPDRDLVDKLEGILPELYSIGDCQDLRTGLEAIADGFLVGNKI